MCGVIGVLGETRLDDLRIALSRLSHRGQDAWGLCWQRSGTSFSRKGSGTIPEKKIKGFSDVFVGATRYPTRGSNVSELEKFAQPFQAGSLILAHNGNITNILEFFDDGAEMESDSEGVSILLKESIDESGFSQGVFDVFSRIDGSWSLVFLYKDDLFAARDRFGIRPLCYAELQQGFGVASESFVLKELGADTVLDVPPGSLVHFKGGEPPVVEQLFDPSPRHCMFEYTYFARPEAVIEGREVYSVRFELGRKLGELFSVKGLEADFVCPVPDTSRPAALGASDFMGIPFREGLMKNRSRSFIDPESFRDKKVREKYTHVGSVIDGKKIFLVDDSIVRGTTMKELVQKVYSWGALGVHVGVCTPVITSACYYGVDMFDQELIGSRLDAESILSELGCDSLTYMTIDSLKDSIGLGSDLCLACLNGDYPTPHARKIRLDFLERCPDKRRHYD